MKRAIFFAGFLSALAAHSQSMSPIVVECGKNCRGSFTVGNSTIQPLAVVVNPVSFSLAPDGSSIYRPLDSSVDVSLSETSVRISPKGQHTFDYQIRCSAYPCLVDFQAGMIVGRTTEGLALNYILSHVVYVDAKGKGARARARTAAGLVR